MSESDESRSAQEKGCDYADDEKRKEKKVNIYSVVNLLKISEFNNYKFDKKLAESSSTDKKMLKMWLIKKLKWMKIFVCVWQTPQLSVLNKIQSW